MSDPNLTFRVRGSSGVEYMVAVIGSGRALRTTCSCPAGRRGGHFCKHATAVLIGDASDVTHGSDRLAEVCDRVNDSPLYVRALHHKPTKLTPSGPAEYQGFDDVLSLHRDELRHLGWEVEVEE